MAYRYTVSFQKEFMSGPMKGIKMWADYRSPDFAHAERDVAKLKAKIGQVRKASCLGGSYRIMDVYSAQI